MAYNVFGNPITNSTLVGMSEYKGKNIITRRDRAYVALKMKNVEEKDKNAPEYVEKLKEKWGAEIEVCTLCLIYNATGDVISLVNNHDWYGQIGAAPFPLKIENGQWGGFLHCKAGSAPAGSHAAVVYRGLNNTGLTCDWMAAWSNPFNRKKITWSILRFANVTTTAKMTIGKKSLNYYTSRLSTDQMNGMDAYQRCQLEVVPPPFLRPYSLLKFVESHSHFKQSSS